MLSIEFDSRFPTLKVHSDDSGDIMLRMACAALRETTRWIKKSLNCSASTKD